MILLILPVLWAAVLLPYWVRFLRDTRAERSLSPDRSHARRRRAEVRYVFGAYEPYRDEHIVRDARALEADVSYLPPGQRSPVRPPAYVAYAPDHYDDRIDEPVDPYDDGDLYEDPYPGNLAAVRTLPSRRPAALAGSRSTAAARGRQLSDAVTSANQTALRRRRQIFLSLVTSFLTSLGVALWSGSVAAWVVHMGIFVMFAGYVSLLVRYHRRMVDRHTKVRRLEPFGDRDTTRPAVVLLSGGTAR